MKVCLQCTNGKQIINKMIKITQIADCKLLLKVSEVRFWSSGSHFYEDGVYKFNYVAGMKKWFADFQVMLEEIEDCPSYLEGMDATVDGSNYDGS